MSRVRDLAVETALDLLEQTVCECGHLNTEHEPTCELCACIRFDPVNFFVTRADAEADEDA